MNTVSKPKKLLVCLLAAAMGASALAGGMLLDANAEAVGISSLVTVTGDAQVESAPKQYTLKNDGDDGTLAGTAVGDTGLYVTSTNDDSADGYSVALNGVFHGSVGMYLAFPGEGFWDGTYREAVMTVTSVTDPDETFRLHIDGSWGTTGYVTYEYEGQTLTRSRSQYYGTNFNSQTGEDEVISIDNNSAYLYTQSSHYFYPIIGNFDAVGSDADPARTACYLGLEYTEEGALNVIMMANSNWGRPYKRVLASFAEDPETFEPSTEQKGITPNLPKLKSLQDGYTIRFDISDNSSDRSIDFLLKSIAVGGQRDAYTNGTTYTFDTETLAEEPEFYTTWKNQPTITVPEYENIVAAGEAITPPAATYSTNGEPEATNPVTNVEYRVNNGDWTTVADNAIPAAEAGDEVYVRYSVPWNETNITQTIQLSVRTMPAEAFSAENVVRVYDPSVQVTPNRKATSNSGETQSSEAGLLLESGIEQSYAFDLVGRFTGNTEIRWGTAADNGWDVNGRVEFIIAEAGNPANYFKVVWLSPYQSRAYVEYTYNGQTLYCAQGRNNSGTYFYVLGDGNGHDDDMISDNWDVMYQPHLGAANSSGILGLEWSGDVLNVMATNESGNKQILASFVNDHEGFTLPEGATGTKSNLPKISFESGYTVSVKVTGSIDFALYGLTTAEDTTSFNTETLSCEPLWYADGVDMPVFEDLPEISGVQFDGGAQVTVPEISYTAASDAELKVEWIKPDESATTVTEGQQLTMTDKGDHILRYTVTVDGVAYTRELVVHVCDYINFISGTKATCTEAGEGFFTCEHGNLTQKEISVDPTAHSVVHHAEVPATCTENGIKEYWECQYCHKNFSSADCTEELDDLTIPAGHTIAAVPKKDATCTEDGYEAHYRCSVCGNLFSDEAGNTEISLEDVTIPATGHSYGEPAWTWTEFTGATAKFTCSACDDEQTVTATITSEVTTPATCETDGVRTYTATATFGEQQYTDTKTEVIAATGHSYGEPEWTWTAFSGATAKFTCANCGDEQEVTATITNEVTTPAACETDGVRTYTATVTFGGQQYTDTKTEAIAATGHHMVQVPAKAPTCTEDGYEAHYRCSVCGNLFSDEAGNTEISLEDVTIPATGHSYGEPAWTWTALSGATATFTCSACGNEQTVTANITSEVTTPAACEAEGVRTYTATVTFGGQTYTNTKTEAIAATGHHMVQVPAKAPTCTEDGNSAYYKCSECGRCSSDDQGEMEIDESSMILKATGHSYEEGICTVCGAEDPDYAPETGLTGGEIAGITIACVAVAGGGAALAIVLIRKRKFKK